MSAGQELVGLHADLAARYCEGCDAAYIWLATVLTKQPGVVVSLGCGRHAADGEELVACHGEHLGALIGLLLPWSPHPDELGSPFDVVDILIEPITRRC